MKRLGITSVLMAALAGCGTAPALQATSSPAQFSSEAIVQSSLQAEFERLDRDHKGYLTHSDLPYLSNAQFAALDRNGDGKLTFDEGLAPSELPALAKVADRVPDTTATTTLATFGLRLGATARPPILLIPGYFEPAAMWKPFEPRLQAAGYTHIYTMEHWPSFDDIRSYSAKCKALVAQIQQETGAQQIDVVGHSMGGLILRYWIERMGGAPSVLHYVSFATPHEGTIDGYFGPGMSAYQMRPGSDFLKDLDAGPDEPAPGKYSALRSNTDEIVIPHDNAILPGAVNTVFPIAEHLELAWLPSAEETALADLSR